MRHHWQRLLLPLLALWLLATACEQVSEFAGIPSTTVEAVEVDVQELRLGAGEKYRLRAWARMTDGNTRWSGLAWTSSDENLGLVDGTGMVTALADSGQFTVTAEADGKVAVTVVRLVPYQQQCAAPAVGERLQLEVGPVQLLQATEIGRPTVPAITGQPVMVRVPVLVDAAAPRRLDVDVTVTVSRGGAVIGTLQAEGPECLGPTPMIDSLGSTFNVEVPESWLRGTLELQATVSHSVPGVTPGRLATPTRTIRVVEPPALELLLVPVDLPRLGTTSPFRESHMDEMLEMTRDLFPLDRINARVREHYTSQAGADVSSLMSELAELRLLEGEQAHYYGLMDALNTRVDFSGMANLDGYIGIGLLFAFEDDAPGSYRIEGAAATLAHELGHNFDRPHTPCGGAGGADGGYPYVGGFTGTHGVSRIWYAEDGNPVLTTPDMLDLMGYCGPRWISDYTYQQVLEYRDRQAREVQSAALVGHGGQALLVSGTIVDGLVALRPSFVTQGGARPPEAGDWTWQLLDGAGNVLAQTAFAPSELAVHDAAPEYLFTFSVPVQPAELARAVRATVVDPSGVERAALDSHDSTDSGLVAQQAAISAVRHGNTVELTWDARAHPAIIVRDADSGTILGRGDSGSLLLQTTADELSIELSQGLSSTQVFVTVQAPGSP